MSIYRRKVRGRKTKTWTAEFRHDGVLHRRGRFPDRETAQFWLQSESLRLKRGDVGYIKPLLNAPVAPLIEEFADWLDGMNRDSEYIYITQLRLNKLAAEAGWINLGDITRQSIERWRRTGPRRTYGKARQTTGAKLTQKTLNQYFDTAEQFGDWLHRVAQKLGSNPLDGIPRGTATGNASYRRAATVAEVNAMLAKAAPDRRRFYEFILYTPLRMRSIRSLVWSDLHLDGDRPWVQIRAVNAKSRRAERSALRRSVAADLAAARGDAADTDLVFPEPPTLSQLRADWEAAGVVYADGEGNRRLDFHSFRKTAVKMLKAAGVPLDEAQRVLHHKDIRTTQKHYDDDQVSETLTDAVERMPAVERMRIAK